MSLEIALQENTNAIRELIATIANGIPTTGAQVAAVVAEAPAQAKAEKKPAAAEKATQSSGGTKPSETSAAPSDTGASAEAKTLVYDDIKKPFLSLVSAKGRDAGAALLLQFGVDASKGGKLTEIPVEKYAEVLEAINKAGE